MATDILKQIVEQKQKEVEAAEARVPLDKLLGKALEEEANRRPFFENLRKPGPKGVNIIAEIKRASPSKGIIREDLDPERQAAAYERGGAAAISVLTDEHFFKGSSSDLKRAKAATSLPILRKDFIISSYQIFEAQAMGADAVLLIASILTRLQLSDFLDLCRAIHLGVLVEVHTPEEIKIVKRLNAPLVGINNRNLRSFETSIDNSIRMVSLLDKGQIPVAESGIRGLEDIQQLKKAGFHNFLIGESLVRSDDPEAFLQSLMKGN